MTLIMIYCTDTFTLFFSFIIMQINGVAVLCKLKSVGRKILKDLSHLSMFSCATAIFKIVNRFHLTINQFSSIFTFFNHIHSYCTYFFPTNRNNGNLSIDFSRELMRFFQIISFEKKILC